MNKMYIVKSLNGGYLSKKKSCFYSIEDEIIRAGFYITKGQAEIARQNANKRFDKKYTFEVIEIEIKEK